MRSSVLKRTDVLFSAGLCAWLSAALASSVITPDSFLCLVLGRRLFEAGLPATDDFTIMGAGKPWIDQQWLAHASLYALQRVTGFAGLSLVRSLTSVVCCVGALSYAAQRGANGWRLVVGGALGLALTLFKAKLRAQLFAEPLFVATLWIGLCDARDVRARRSLALPVIALVWANVHGSVLLGVGLAVLCWLARLVQARGRLFDRAGTCEAVALCLACAAVLASPYGARVIAYYRDTLTNPLFRLYLKEWRSPDWSEGSFLIVIGSLTAVALLLRHRALRSCETLVTVSLLALSFYSVRYALFFGYALMFCAPLLLQLSTNAACAPTPRWFDRLGRALAASGGAVLLVVAATFDNLVDEQWQPETSRTVAALAGPHGRVFAEMRHADRLLWQSPELAGRVAFDARFELLRLDQVEAVDAVLSGKPSAALHDYDVFVLANPELAQRLRSAGFKLSMWDDQTQVLEPPRR